MNEFFTWAGLATYAGATALTAMFTQLFKGVSFIDKIPTRFFAYIVAFVVLIGANFFAGTLTLETAGLAVVNAVVVALAASGGYDVVKNQIDKHDDSGEQGDVE
jgi:hypothetical protein